MQKKWFCFWWWLVANGLQKRVLCLAIGRFVVIIVVVLFTVGNANTPMDMTWLKLLLQIVSQ